MPVDGSGVTQPVSGTVTANQGTAAAIAGAWPIEVTDGTNVLGTSSHPLQTISAVASSSTITQTTLVNNTNATILAANANRKKAIIFVASSTVQIKLGAVASTTSFTYKVTTNNTTIEITGWTGQIDAFGSASTITVTELT